MPIKEDLPLGENNPPGSLVLTSEEMPYGQVVVREVELGDKRIIIEGLSREGLVYSGEKKASEDSGLVLKDSGALQAIIVDGGTQIEPVSTLSAMGLSGGRYIATRVERFAPSLDPSLSAATNLRILNAEIGKDIKIHHPSVTFAEHSYNTPYGSIAAARVDVENNILEVANAGDVFVVVVRKDGKPELLSVDDVYQKDHATFTATRRVADRYGVTFGQAMQQRATDPRFHEIVEEMKETMRQGNVGMIRRITGAPNFGVTSSVVIPLDEVKSVFLFTDGGVPPGFSISTTEGLDEFLKLVNSSGLQGLNEEIQRKLLEDPDYEQFPRFGTVDDLMILKIHLMEQL